ncbi:cuticle protein 7-like [Pollicipes pollicipes]|uniref:cuticle protein 7-like n=1 Tax=Pollicipes pollicipes TaxID=41117 RepID=UPI0018855A69|nr:cuticle protein 7-like [Pollicipes pollicipes]
MTAFLLPQVFIIAALLAVASAAPANSYAPQPAYSHGPSYHQSSYKEPANYDTPYQFDYAVNDHYSGAVFSQNENSDTKNVNGYYSVNLPDGRTQHVKYIADQHGYGGYNAEVTYTGEPRYEEHKPSYHPAPAYKPARSYAPAPAYKPARSYAPAPAYKPARSYAPAPAYKPARSYAPAPASVARIVFLRL